MYASKTMCDMNSPYRHSNKVGQILALCYCVVYVRIISLRLQLIFLLGVCVHKIYAHLIEKEGWVVYN